MNRQTFNEINITPLTDIFLVLLILMMVIAPILDQQGISLAVPEYVAESNENKNTKILTVEVNEKNEFFVNNSVVDENNLFEILKEESKTFTDGLLIKASGESSHQSVVKVMDEARNAGVASISIVEIWFNDLL